MQESEIQCIRTFSVKVILKVDQQKYFLLILAYKLISGLTKLKI